MNLRQVLEAASAAGLLVLAVLVGSAPRTDYATPDPVPGSGPGSAVIVVGTGGIGPGDLDPQTTPALWGLLRDGSSAALNITSVHTTTCPLDGWLTLSAGDRAAQPDDGSRTPPCQPLPEVVGGAVTGWDALAATAAALPFDARPGTLAAQLAASGQCLAAIGPGAAVGAALPPAGSVPRYRPYDATTLAVDLGACRTTLVDVGAVRDPGRDVAAPGQVPLTRQLQVSGVDSRVAEVLSAAPTGADVVVVSLADAGDRAGLRVVLAAGPRFGPGSLSSSSTRHTGLVQLDDVTATILSLAGTQVPATVGGSALRRSPVTGDPEASAERRLADLVDYDLSSRSVQPIVYPFFLTGGLLVIAAVAALALVWRRGIGTSHQRDVARSVVRQGLVVAAAVPVATFLANILPWWRFTRPAVALVAAVVVWSAVLGAIALRGAWRRSPMGPVGAMAAMTYLVLAVDVMHGSRLQLSSLLGLNPIVGGRYFGMGNVTFALFLAATFLVSIAASSRLVRTGHPRLAALAVALVGLLAVVVDAAPMGGSDVGGPPALVPGLAVLVLSILRIDITWRRGLLIVGGTAALVLALALVDWSRPVAGRSHLGRFVQSVIDGDAGGIVTRKLAQNLDTLTQTTVFAYLVPLALILLVTVLARPRSALARPLQPLLERVETMRAGLIGLSLSLVIGTLLNDTGVAIPPVASALAVPLLLAAGIRLAELRSGEDRAATPAERRHD